MSSSTGQKKRQIMDGPPCAEAVCQSAQSKRKIIPFIAHLFGNITNNRLTAFLSLLERTCLLPPACQGSITVEAAVVLPLFLFVLLTVLGFANMMETQLVIQHNLMQSGKQLAREGYLRQELQQGDGQGMSAQWLNGQFEIVNVRQRLCNALREQLDTDVIVGGVSGISFHNTRMMDGDEIIDLVVTYRMRPPVYMILVPEFQMIQRCRMRAWIGMERQTGAERQVFVTPHGTVYHTNPACTYLKLSVREVSKQSLGGLRNKNGGRYSSCRGCVKQKNADRVYITDYGDRYHESRQCGGLKRGIMMKPESQIGNLSPCSRCTAS